MCRPGLPGCLADALTELGDYLAGLFFSMYPLMNRHARTFMGLWFPCA
jgi:hypothetical protein